MTSGFWVTCLTGGLEAWAKACATPEGSTGPSVAPAPPPSSAHQATTEPVTGVGS